MTDPKEPAAETFVSSAPETSALGGSQKASGKKKASKSHPWRDNIEAIAISIIMIVLFKYFVLEAYKIPTGSMQPTLMGNEETGIYDRVIVDKLSYHFRDPERFEIAVFKYPLDSSKNFIKRIVGMPGELLFLKGGDPWVQPDGETSAHVLRRSRAIQNAQLRRLETRGEWKTPRAAATAWTIDTKDSGDLIVAKGRGEATFPGPRKSIRDGYLDGYPKGMKSKMSSVNKDSDTSDVSDLRVRADIVADEGCREVAIILHEGQRRFRFILPGPAAEADARATIEVTGLDASEMPDGAASVTAPEAPRLRAGEELTVEVQNLNDLLTLRIAGGDVLTLEIPPAPDHAAARVTIAVEAPDGSGATLSRTRVWRDIYYKTNPRRQKVTRWQIPPGHYVVLGDNSQDSSDGRDWTLAGFSRLKGENVGEIILGNQRGGRTVRPDTNPLFLTSEDGAEQIFFRDVLGEKHVFAAGDVERIPDVQSSLVPRSLIRGRAVLVVWPLAPQHDVYRLKWVR